MGLSKRVLKRQGQRKGHYAMLDGLCTKGRLSYNDGMVIEFMAFEAKSEDVAALNARSDDHYLDWKRYGERYHRLSCHYHRKHGGLTTRAWKRELKHYFTVTTG